jgi:hypothetical protein
MFVASILSAALLLFQPVLSGWTWVSGTSSGGDWGFYEQINVTSPRNIPCGSYEQRIVFHNGKMYIFGGFIVFGTTSNNLYRWDPGTDSYVCLFGDGNSYPGPVWGPSIGRFSKQGAPGGRIGSTFSVDPEDNALYVFGGLMTASTYTNAVSKFDLGSLQWAWVSGSLQYGASAQYGTKGVAARENNPPALYSPAYFSEPSQRKLYIFGGSFIAYQTSIEKKYADTWCFDYQTYNWTWLHGTGLENQKVFCSICCKCRLFIPKIGPSTLMRISLALVLTLLLPMTLQERYSTCFLEWVMQELNKVCVSLLMI